MTLGEFTATLTQPSPPDDCSPALAALWHDARGDWEQAHHVAQEIHDEDGAWVHAYLHRKEGDTCNAVYWYRRACRPLSDDPLPDEWTQIVQALL